ncbi:uncharacterized protein LOC129928446 [Biomphalaria glabrata]|uniref:Uncharacterized protein LOC129928446 n=1 Tax=Biomphalaria glabrata TaxID=6526 RepID=A0A9W3BHI2_BIOGL|nr:uncharacterized protein LOC129928446 [Biomphalaria glabrata]
MNTESQAQSKAAEAHLQKHVSTCKKNPGHTSFTPILLFSLEHLPESHQDLNVYNLIKAQSDLTVRVHVDMISPHRPTFWPGTDKSYPGHNTRGEATNSLTGSGVISAVVQFTDTFYTYIDTPWKMQCWCSSCEVSGSPSNVWWEFEVLTAAHVVFDQHEAEHTVLRLFYDAEDSPKVTVDKVKVQVVNIRRDFCKLKGITCDQNLAEKLMHHWENFLYFWEKVNKKYKRSRDIFRLTIIVSHPHGCSKQVSVGHWKKKVKLDRKNFTKFAYTTSTCPGSSGALVHCVGYSRAWWWDQLVHRESDLLGYNISNIAQVL